MIMNAMTDNDDDDNDNSILQEVSYFLPLVCLNWDAHSNFRCRFTNAPSRLV